MKFLEQITVLCSTEGTVLQYCPTISGQYQFLQLPLSLKICWPLPLAKQVHWFLAKQCLWQHLLATWLRPLPEAQSPSSPAVGSVSR